MFYYLLWQCFPEAIQIYIFFSHLYTRSLSMYIYTHVCVCAQSLQLCPTLCNPMDHSPVGSSVHGILQARILEWVAISFSRGSSWPRDWTHVSCIGRWVLFNWATWDTAFQTGILHGELCNTVILTVTHWALKRDLQLSSQCASPLVFPACSSSVKKEKRNVLKNYGRGPSNDTGK